MRMDRNTEPHKSGEYKLLVLGNGPSLKKEFFDSFGDIPCLGMNAAYRYWHRINWYPEIYCCLDDQVVLSHAEAIYSLVRNRHCKTFFLHHNILSRYPDLVGVPEIYFLPQLQPGAMNEEICRKLSISYIPSDWFKSSQPSKLTTGAYSVRFGALLGYTQIGLLGVDCRYVEVVRGAKQLDNIILEIESDPIGNENYFFEDYQTVGDRYNLPNPSVHGGNLHLQAFEALANDIKRLSWNLDINICTKESEIYDKNIFSYVPLRRFISSPSLSAVFVPFTKNDLDGLLKNLLRWGEPGFVPLTRIPESPSVELHCAMNGAVDYDIEADIKYAYDKAGLDRFFGGVFFHYSNLVGLDDLYTRVFEGNVGPAGYMAGPNNQFFDIVSKFSRGMSHIVLLEPDAVPIRPNWLKAIEDIVRQPDRFWICGSYYRGRAMIESLNHINGNAIYNVGDPGFRDFFENAFLPHFYRRVKDLPHICYDIVIHDMFTPVYAGRATEELVSLWKETAHLFRFSEWIVDISHADDRAPDLLMSTKEAQDKFPGTYLLHGAVRRLFEEQDKERFSSSESLEIGEKSGCEMAVDEVVVLDPDALNNFGHYLSYDDRFKSACDKIGLACTVFGNVDCEDEILLGRPFFTRVFSEHSWGVGRSSVPDSPVATKFGVELRSALHDLLRCRNKQSTLLYMYCGSLSHAHAIDDVLKDFPDVSACVNLFWITFENYEKPAFVSLWWPVLERVVRSPRVAVTVPTERCSENLKRVFNVSLPVAPHPSPTFDDEMSIARLAVSEQTVREAADLVTVLFPGGMRDEKGIRDTIQAVRMLAENKDYSLNCVVRAKQAPNASQVCGLKEELAAVAQCELRSEDMSDSDFACFLASGDIIVLPYYAPDFSERTSGLLIDAMVLGKPVIVYDGTWLADVVRHYDSGVIVEHRNINQLCEAVIQICSDIDGFSKRARLAGERYVRCNSWARLLQSVISTPKVGTFSRRHGTQIPKPSQFAGAPIMRSGRPSRFRKGIISIFPVARFRRWFDMRYLRFATAVRGRSLILFRMGQIAMGILRAARRRPRAAFGVVAAVLALAILPVYPPLWPYRAYLWGAALLAGMFGASVALASVVHEALQRLLDRQRVEAGAAVRAASQASERRIAALEGQVKQLVAALEARISMLGEDLERTGALEARISTLGEDLGRTAAKAEKTQSELETQVKQLVAQVEQNAPFQHFNRVLTPEHARTLEAIWSERLGVHVTRPSLAYIAHSIRVNEQNAVGRLATQIEDAVLRTLVSMAPKGDTLEVLEIGTLFGIGLGMLYDNNRGRYKHIHLTAIDPLTGYYGKGEVDVLLNIPIDQSIFWHNMERIGVPREDVTLIDRLSTDKEALELAGGKRYDLLVIDGDHSYQGVKTDYDLYMTMVKPGGFIIVDDYGSEDWPDVKQFVDAEVLDDARVELLGVEWRTAVFKVK